jgi:hypothetical protein
VDVARIVLGYVQALAWPAAAVILLMRYQRIIEKLLPGTIIKWTLGGVTIETTLKILKKAIEESSSDEGISQAQWSQLEDLEDGPREYDHTRDYDLLMPLRNSGLIRPRPRGFLTQAKKVEITALGRLLIQARIEQGTQVKKTVT